MNRRSLLQSLIAVPVLTNLCFGSEKDANDEYLLQIENWYLDDNNKFQIYNIQIDKYTKQELINDKLYGRVGIVDEKYPNMRIYKTLVTTRNRYKTVISQYQPFYWYRTEYYEDKNPHNPIRIDHERAYDTKQDKVNRISDKSYAINYTISKPKKDTIIHNIEAYQELIHEKDNHYRNRHYIDAFKHNLELQKYYGENYYG